MDMFGEGAGNAEGMHSNRGWSVTASLTKVR